MLGELLRRLRGRTSSLDDLLPQTIDQVVSATDTRLALLPGYRRALTPGMRKSLAYVDTLTDLLPDVLDLSLRAFTSDRRIGLFFASPESLLFILKKNQALQDYFESAANGDEAYALLLMQRTDNVRYCVVNQSGEIRSDVAQTVVSFDHHRLLLPSPSMEALRQRSPRRGLEVLTGAIARRLAQLEKERGDIECELTRIRLRLSALANPGMVVIDAMTSGGAELPHDRDDLTLRRDTLQERLQELKSVTELSGILELVGHMLEHPEDYFRVSQSSVCLDRMGIELRNATAEDATRLCLEEVLLGRDDPVRRVLLPVRVSREGLADLERCVTG